LLLLLQYPNSTWDTVACLGIFGTVQKIFGAPLLLSYPTSYLRKAFELDRVFFYKWTVNWKVRTCVLMLCTICIVVHNTIA
jgi:alpha-1,3-mannosyltransferase